MRWVPADCKTWQIVSLPGNLFPPEQVQWLSAFRQRRMPRNQNVPVPSAAAYHTADNACWYIILSCCWRLVFPLQKWFPFRRSVHPDTDTWQTYRKISVLPTEQSPLHYAFLYVKKDFCNNDFHPQKACPLLTVQRSQHHLSWMYHWVCPTVSEGFSSFSPSALWYSVLPAPLWFLQSTAWSPQSAAQ